MHEQRAEYAVRMFRAVQDKLTDADAAYALELTKSLLVADAIRDAVSDVGPGLDRVADAIDRADFGVDMEGVESAIGGMGVEIADALKDSIGGIENKLADMDRPS